MILTFNHFDILVAARRELADTAGPRWGQNHLKIVLMTHRVAPCPASFAGRGGRQENRAARKKLFCQAGRPGLTHFFPSPRWVLIIYDQVKTLA
jgi:hypothetical protein